MTDIKELSKARMFLLEALIDRGKAIPDNVHEPGMRGVHMLRFNDEKIKSALRIIDDIIRGSASKAKTSE